MGTASLILGIVSIAVTFFGEFANFAWAGSICGILGIIFGAIGLKSPKKGQATAGLVLSIIALAWGIIATIVCAACVGAGLGALGALYS